MAFTDFFKKRQALQKFSEKNLGGQAREKLTRPAPETASVSSEKNTPEIATAPAGTSRTAGILLERPHITEKTTRLAETGTYVFRVASMATRPAIRRAVEELYKVRVVRVNVLSQPSSAVKHGRHPGERPGFRKAMVTLQKGYTIEFV